MYYIQIKAEVQNETGKEHMKCQGESKFYIRFPEKALLRK